MKSCMFVRLSVRLQPGFPGISPLLFSEILHSDRNLETEKSESIEFPRKILICPIKGKFLLALFAL